MKKSTLRIAGVVGAGVALAIAGCAAISASRHGDRAENEAVALMKKDFKPRGQATLDRLDQDPLQKACTESAESGKALPADEARRLQQTPLAAIR